MSKRPIRIAVRPPVEAGGDLKIHVVTEGLTGLDPCLYPAVFSALAVRCGLDHEVMAKAVKPTGGARPDPRYPDITKLIAQAELDWSRWGHRLVDQVLKQVQAGKLLPMTSAAEKRLRVLLDDNAASWLTRISGREVDPAQLKRLVKAGLVSKGRMSYVEAAYRLGRGIDPTVPRELPTPKQRARPLSASLRHVRDLSLTERDRATLAYIRRRGFVYMRRPAEKATSEVDRLLSEAEFSRLRNQLEVSVQQGQDWRALAGDLREAVAGTQLVNDMRRVARTELLYAHNHAAAETLREAAAGAGEPDPEVFKLVSPGACVDCRRIWGPMAQPNVFKLSMVEQFNGGNGNFGLPRRSWGPAIGPIHPNCTEGPLQYYRPELFARAQEIAVEISKTYGPGIYAEHLHPPES